eukprot:GILJ01006527.1.p1 GENE.GILJ01006527.1~~GILJ01006527.1.p1  ORF type:complete len:771 (+),score=137.34 GILJ01006527.1:897-3209(+)
MYVSLEDGWNTLRREGIERLQSVIDSGYQVSFNNHDYVKLYTLVYTLCTDKAVPNVPASLYERFEDSLKDYLGKKILPGISRLRQESMLRQFNTRWSQYKILQKWMVKFFNYLDRFYIKRQSLPSLDELTLTTFRDLVFYQVVKELREAFLEQIEKERTNQSVPHSLLHGITKMAVELGMGQLEVYEEHIEKAVLQQAAEHYRQWSATRVLDCHLADYLLQAEQSLESEKIRVRRYLHPSTEKKLLRVVEEEMLKSPLTQLLNKESGGLDVLLNEEKINDLARMFRLYQGIETGLPPIARYVQNHLIKIGNDLVTKEQGTPDYVIHLLDLYQRSQRLVDGPFKGHSVFHGALKESFEVVLNREGSRAASAELLAGFFDKLLRKEDDIGAHHTGPSDKQSAGVMSESEINKRLDQAVNVFVYLIEKDLFLEFYKKHLARRLLQGRAGVGASNIGLSTTSSMTDCEKQMIAQLKSRCGAQFTSKLEGMVTDLNLAHELQVSFQSYLEERRTPLGVDFSVHVLTSGFWPAYKVEELKLPSELIACISSFQDFYHHRTSNRTLKWLHALGSVTVSFKAQAHPQAGPPESARGQRDRYDLVLSTLQACVLLLFNFYERLSIEEMLKLLQCAEDELKKHVAALVFGRFKILNKVPAESHVIKNDDTFTVNIMFSDKKRKIKIPMLVSKAQTQDPERKQTIANVTEDRKHTVEAAIVRTMKARKTLDHQGLVVTVTEQVLSHFKPDPKMIKKCVEDLIGREYLERSKEDPNVYNYLA